MNTPLYELNADKFRALAAAGQLAGYAIDVDQFDPNDINHDAPDTNDETIGDLIRGAWVLGAVTGPAEPLFVYEQQADSYYFRFDLGKHPARARLLTDGKEWRHLADNGTTGHEAALSVLSRMVDELNATLHSFANYLNDQVRKGVN